MEWNHSKACLQDWMNKNPKEILKALRVMVCWGIWLERNATIHEDQGKSYIKVVYNNLVLQESLPKKLLNIPNHHHSKNSIQKDQPWDYFDGEASLIPSLERLEGPIHLSENHIFSFHAILDHHIISLQNCLHSKFFSNWLNSCISLSYMYMGTL